MDRKSVNPTVFKSNVVFFFAWKTGFVKRDFLTVFKFLCQSCKSHQKSKINPLLIAKSHGLNSFPVVKELSIVSCPKNKNKSSGKIMRRRLGLQYNYNNQLLNKY